VLLKLYMKERAFKLDKYVAKIKAVQYTEQWELKKLNEGKGK